MAPEQLIQLSLRLQLTHLSITDHDSTDGYIKARTFLSDASPLKLIPGIEINTQGGSSAHILGYGIDVYNEELQNSLTNFRIYRRERLLKMTEKIQSLGFPLTFDDVLAAAPNANSLGRPHIADALKAKKIVRNRKEAFDRFLQKGKPAYIESEVPTLKHALDLITKAGGITVLAHPSYYMSENLLTEMKTLGLRGVEIFYPEHTKSLIQRYRDLAKSLGLYVTGGSDFHGPGTSRDRLACVNVPEEALEMFHF